MRPLIGHTTSELEQLASSFGEPSFRGGQLSGWIYRLGAKSFDQMTDLPLHFRRKLAEAFELGLPNAAHADFAPDGTVKYLLELADGEQVESVYLPYEDRVS